MSMTNTQRAEALYARLRDVGCVTGLEIIPPDKVRPMKGSILIALPPTRTQTKGGIELPTSAQKPPSYACVLAVPDDENCPVKPGEWVIFRPDHEIDLPLAGHRNVAYLQYADDATCEFMFAVSEEDMNKILSKVAAEERHLQKEVDCRSSKVYPETNPVLVTV